MIWNEMHCMGRMLALSCMHAWEEGMGCVYLNFGHRGRIMDTRAKDLVDGMPWYLMDGLFVAGWRSR